MKQVNNTECGPVIVCDDCFESMNRHSIETGQGAVMAEDVTNTVPTTQQCDLCGAVPMKVR